MASIDDEILLRAKISSLESRISQVEETEEEVQTALEKSDSYRGMSNQAELTAVLQALFRKEEHLRTKEEQLRDEMLLWRRIHEKHKVFTSSVTGTAASTPSTGPNDEASSSSSMSDSSSTQTCDGENEHSAQMCDGEKVDSAEGPTQFSVNVYIAAPGANTECIHFEDLPPTITASCLHRRVQRRTGLSETTLRFETDMENADEVLKRVYPPGTLEDVYMVRTIETRRSTTVCFLRVDAGSVTMRDYFPGMTVLTLKSMIRARFGHPIKEQRLICAGQSLEDDRTLFSYRVEDMSTVILTGRLRGGKPVILLYPPNELEVSVRVGLSSDWSFSVLYPKPSDESLRGRNCQWIVRAFPDGKLLHDRTNMEYSCLFWEADSADGRVVMRFDLDRTPSFCVAGDKAGAFLDDALVRLGLNVRERCDMITYWLLQLEAYPFNVIYFVDVQRYAQVAKLDITPVPDVIIRVFMVFRGLESYDAQLDTAELGDLQAPAREGFVAVEWGGMNLNGPV